MDTETKDEARWRSDIDALVFPVPEHSAWCAVHRRAFRTLLKFEPALEDCLGYFHSAQSAFQAAARAKITEKHVPVGMNFHLTSRDVARKLTISTSEAIGER